MVTIDLIRKMKEHDLYKPALKLGLFSSTLPRNVEIYEKFKDMKSKQCKYIYMDLSIEFELSEKQVKKIVSFMSK